MSTASLYLLCCILLFGATILSCQGRVDQELDIFVVKIHTTKLSKGNPKKGQKAECNFLGVFEDLKAYQSLSQTKFVVYGNNAPVGTGHAAGEVDFLQYRDTEEHSKTAKSEPVYPILVEIMTMLDKSELDQDKDKLDMIKSCVKKHVKTSRLNTKYIFITQANDGSEIVVNPNVSSMLCNFD